MTTVIFENKYVKGKTYHKVRDNCHYTGKYRGAARSTFNLKYSVPKNIPSGFHNGCNYDYHFVITELAEKFQTRFNCLEENT